MQHQCDIMKGIAKEEIATTKSVAELSHSSRGSNAAIGTEPMLNIHVAYKMKRLR